MRHEFTFGEFRRRQQCKQFVVSIPSKLNVYWVLHNANRVNNNYNEL